MKKNTTIALSVAVLLVGVVASAVIIAQAALLQPSRPGGLLSPVASTTVGIGGTSVTGGTAGSVLFLDSGTYLAQNNNSLFWLDSSSFLRIGTSSGTSSPVSSLDLRGSLSLAITSTTASTTLTSAHHTVLCNATSAAVTLFLPTSSQVAGREYVIKKIEASNNSCSMDPNASELIEGTSTPYAITSSTTNMSIRVQSDGTQWWILQ